MALSATVLADDLEGAIIGAGATPNAATRALAEAIATSVVDHIVASATVTVTVASGIAVATTGTATAQTGTTVATGSGTGTIS